MDTADPDYSNPTRRRTERPLETIMSFEAAIDREYKRQREAAREANRQSFAQNGKYHFYGTGWKHWY